MPLEIADYIDELVPANPTTADGVNQGDDHLRLLKQVLQNALPGNTAPGVFDGPFDINGELKGTTVTDGTYDLATIGATVSRISAYGVITGNTTFDGVGVTAVSQPTAGEWLITFADAAPTTDKQICFYSAPNASPGGSSFVVGIGDHISTTQCKVYLRLQAGATTAITSGFPIDIFRMVLP